MCKAGFLHRFRELARTTKQHSLLELRTYADVKGAAHDYQKAKLVLYDHLDGAGKGRWLTKPPELAMFEK